LRLDRISQLVLYAILDRKRCFAGSTKRVTKTTPNRQWTTSRTIEELSATPSSRNRPIYSSRRYGMEISNSPRSKYSPSSSNRTSYRRLLRTPLPKHSSCQPRFNFSLYSRKQRQLSDDFSLRKGSTETHHHNRTCPETSRTQCDVCQIHGCATRVGNGACSAC